MYHIKNDKRQIDSASLIMTGLTNCLRNHKMSEITVSELSEASGVSRSTFYRMFDTPVDVLEYTCEVCISKAIKDYSSETFGSDEDFIAFTFSYWYNHTDILEAALNCGRLDIIQKSFMDHSKHLVDDLRKDFTENELDYLRMGIVGLISNILMVWIEHGRKENPGQMFQLYKKFYDMLVREDTLRTLASKYQ